MWHARQPLHQPVDIAAPEITQVLCALLWEEIRPVSSLELRWTPEARHRPAPEELVITTLNSIGSASSWWHNLDAVPQAITPSVTDDGLTYVYPLQTPTCGIVISVGDGGTAVDYDVPATRVLVANSWKKMTVEIEWGFAPATDAADYSGHLALYDGMVSGLRSLAEDHSTTVIDAASWRSTGTGAVRRGLTFELLYMGDSTWRRVQPFTSQQDDVARTIVTLWTASGNFSFLASDLENGPILAPGIRVLCPPDFTGYPTATRHSGFARHQQPGVSR